MGWFEDQIDLRRKNDQSALSDAYGSAIDAILGERFSFDEAEDSLAQIVRFYGLPAVKKTITDPEVSGKMSDIDRLNAVCRISGIMRRAILLEPGWNSTTFGALLCQLRATNEYVAVIPDQMGKYAYFDPQTRRRVQVSDKNENVFLPEAIWFSKPLPPKKLSLIDLLKLCASHLNLADGIWIVGLMAAATLVGLLLPKLSYFLFGQVIEVKQISLLLSTLVFMITINISVIFLNSMKSFYLSTARDKMSLSLQNAAMMRLLSLPTQFFRKFTSGEIAQRLGYMEAVSMQLVDMLLGTALTSLFSLSYLTQIFSFAKALVIPSLLVILANLLFSVYTTFRQMKLTKRQMELSALCNGTGIEMISGIQKVKMSGSEKRMFARYTKLFSEIAHLTYNPPFFNKYNTVIALAISLAGQLALYAISLGAEIDAAQYYAFQTAYAMVSAALSSLVSIALQVAQLKPSLEMIRPLLEALPENLEGTQEVGSLSGGIEMNNVTFRYGENSPNVIENFSLKIRPGQYVAIVGRTGCGKSTLVRLLLGFETPQRGAIYYDGKDLARLEKRSLRQKIGAVMQGDKLFSGDIYSNIVISAPELPLQSAWDAAEIAGIAEDIRKMPMGMNTMISEGGGGISGGQRQRLAIARAVAPKPSILIFDEATSALDNLTQKQISESLDKLRCTRIVIAHRLSTIRHCDRILFMDHGKITEEGTYEELIAKGGQFAELVKRQRLDL